MFHFSRIISILEYLALDMHQRIVIYLFSQFSYQN